MTSSSINISGIPEIRRALQAEFDKTDLALRRGLKDMAEQIALESEQLVPVDEGALRSSRTVVDSSGPGNYVVTVGYGGPSAPYALVQHERLDFWHPPKPPNKNSAGMSGTGIVTPGTGRGPKYLEIPFLKMKSRFPDVMVAYARRARSMMGRST